MIDHTVIDQTKDEQATPPQRTPFPAGLLLLLASPRTKLVAFLVFVAGGLYLGATRGSVGIGELQQVSAGLGVWGPPLFAAGYAMAVVILLPAAPFTLAAGLLFGPVVGTLTALAGATVGASGAFWVGRTLGRQGVERFGGRRFASLDRFLARRGTIALLIVRLVPLFPFNLINVGSGVTGIRFRDYLIATSVGIIPGTAAYAILGGSFTDPRSPLFLFAVGIFLVVTVGAAIAVRRLRGEVTGSDAASDDRSRV